VNKLPYSDKIMNARMWKPTTWELLNCIFCQEKLIDVNHCTVDCPHTRCKICKIKGHLSIDCKFEKEQKYYNRLHKLRGMKSNLSN
jgi:hypothetical protein